MADDARPLETSADLKHRIDSGRAGDRSGGFDPAAAPLGTDAEAAAAAPEPRETAQAMRQESAPVSTARKNAAEPELAPDARVGASSEVIVGYAIGAAAAVAFGALLWLAVG